MTDVLVRRDQDTDTHREVPASLGGESAQESNAGSLGVWLASSVVSPPGIWHFVMEASNWHNVTENKVRKTTGRKVRVEHRSEHESEISHMKKGLRIQEIGRN